MGKPLIIVESPTKATTIKRYLKDEYEVLASVGHIKDLPKTKLGVDIAKNFEPDYEAISGKSKIIAAIKKAAKDSPAVYLAPDPDREGEAIAWHLAESIKGCGATVYRVLFNEITKNKIVESLASPGKLDEHKYQAQVARRVLDRLVGYKISPILWKKVRRGLSAGRVQSVALRILCDREQAIAAFVKEEYWKLAISSKAPTGETVSFQLAKIDGQQPELGNKAASDAIVAAITGKALHIAKIARKQRQRRPLPPFITSTLQQEAASKYRYSPKKTMMLAQRLYEGVDLGGDAVAGLITYMRTDSVRVSDDAIAAVREYIDKTYGKNYLPKTPNVYKTKKSAQDAHEAIRPTVMAFHPDQVKAHLEQDAYKLYKLIWDRFVASQMEPACFDQTSVDADIGKYTFRATGSILTFKGFLKVYHSSLEEDDEEGLLPASLAEGLDLVVQEILPTQHFTQPPPRFTESTLVKELEENGIGRPSTYATILTTLQEKKYVAKTEGKLVPSELGTVLNELLIGSFPKILDVDFTAKLEEKLDSVEEGKIDWHAIVAQFYTDFEIDLEKAEVDMRDVKREEIPTDLSCERCNSPMVIKWGRNGQFLACSNYPTCKNTKEFTKDEQGVIAVSTQETTGEPCEKCGSPLVIKRGKFGKFIACSNYPTCKLTKSFSTGITCPVAGCGGVIVEKRSKRGKVFYGCDNYPKCTFATWDQPIAKPCPLCEAPFLTVKTAKNGTVSYKCVTEGCGYKEDIAPPE